MNEEKFECLDRAKALEEITKLMPNMDDAFLNDLIGDLKRPPATCIEEQRDIVMTIRPGLDSHSIEMIQAIEKEIDAALLHFGLTRSKSSKWGHRIDFIYYQFGCVGVKKK